MINNRTPLRRPRHIPLWIFSNGAESTRHNRDQYERRYQFADDDSLLHPTVLAANQRLMQNWCHTSNHASE